MVFWAHDWGKEGEETLELDVRRCRRNALKHSAHDFSVFCPLDSVAPAEAGKLADYSWVELQSPKREHSRKPRVHTVPYYGPGWYHRVAVERLLHFAQVTWQDISHSLSSTGSVSHRNAWQNPETDGRSLERAGGICQALDQPDDWLVGL